MDNRGKKKIVKRIVIGLAIIIIAVLALLWNRYLNKNSLLRKYETPYQQEVYLLGTLHKDHFNKWINYSMEDILSVVKNVQPDCVFIEAREEYFRDYGVVDGPIDMSVIYSYCLNNDIPVEMVDWWVVDNSFKTNSTNDRRDDMIFNKIDNKLKVMDSDKKVLVVCGAGHFYKQDKRFKNNEYKYNRIKNKATYLKSKDIAFEYPAGVEDVWKQRAYFYAYTMPQIIGQDNTLDDDIKAGFTEGNHDEFYNQQLKFCELFINNELYQ